MRVEQKLQEMGLTLPDLPQPNGLYVPSRRVGNLIYIAGQTPDIHGVRQVVGVVGEDLTIEDGQRSARICALNILAVLKAELGDLDKVKQFVQIISYVRCGKNFGDQPAVINSTGLPSFLRTCTEKPDWPPGWRSGPTSFREAALRRSWQWWK